MSVSIVIPWRDRAQIATTIPTFIAEARAVGGEVVLVNLGGNESDLRRYLGSHADGLRVVNRYAAEHFSKPRAMNIGAALCTHDVLFFCDCDVVLEAGSVAALRDAVLGDAGTFATLRYVVEAVPTEKKGHILRCDYALRIILRSGREVRIENHEHDMPAGHRKAPGLLCVRREHFREIQGYNSHLSGWGWEDQDMICRLTLGLGLRRRSMGQGVHLTHDDEQRTTAYEQKDKWLSRDRAFRHALAAYDRGEFLGTLSADSAETVSAERRDGR